MLFITEIRSFLFRDAKRSACLDDKPSKHLTNVSFQHYGQIYNGDRQCKIQYGKGSSHCKKVSFDVFLLRLCKLEQGLDLLRVSQKDCLVRGLTFDMILKHDDDMNGFSCNMILALKDKSGVDKIIVKKQPYQPLNTSSEFFLKDKSGVDKIIVKKQPYQLPNTSREFFLKDKSGVDKIIVKKQPYQLLNTSREFFLKDKSGVDKIIVKKQPYQLMNTSREFFLKDKSGVDKIIVKKQSYQLVNTNRESFPSFDASNFHELVRESS